MSFYAANANPLCNCVTHETPKPYFRGWVADDESTQAITSKLTTTSSPLNHACLWLLSLQALLCIHMYDDDHTLFLVIRATLSHTLRLRHTIVRSLFRHVYVECREEEIEAHAKTLIILSSVTLTTLQAIAFCFPSFHLHTTDAKIFTISPQYICILICIK